GAGAFTNWALEATVAAPPTGPTGACQYQFDDPAIRDGLSYAYRVRAHSVQTTTDPSDPAIVDCASSNRTCSSSPPDAGVSSADGGMGGPGTLTIHTYRRSGLQALEPASASWVAVQDGDAPFARIDSQNGLYTVQITDAAGRYGVAVACTLGPTPYPPPPPA